MTRRNVMWLVFLAAGVRGLALWDDGDSLLYQAGGLDAPQYLDMARRFTTGEWPDPKPFFWAPGYSVFLGLLLSISASATWLKLAQVALGTASCVLVGLLASRLFQDQRVAIVSGVIAALYGPLVYYDLQIAPASLDVFLHLALLLLLLEARDRDALGLWCAAGFVAAASAVTRGSVLLLLPFAAGWLLWPPHERPARSSRLAALIALITPVALALALVAQHNVEGDRTWGSRPARTGTSSSEANAATGGLFLSYNLGINLVLGNVRELHATNRIEHPLCLLNYKMLVFKPVLEGAAKPSAQSSFLVAEAWSWMRAHPLEWLQLIGIKALELVHGEEISRDTSIEASGVDNRVLDLLLWKHAVAFPSGLVIPLALLGIALAPKRTRAHGLVLGALAAHALFVLAFFVTTRYRLALWTTAIPYAGYAAVTAFDAVRARRLSTRSSSIALALLAVCNYGLSPEPQTHAAFEHDHLGALLSKEGRHEEAVAHWKTALAIDPSYAQAHFQLASDYAKQADLSTAASHYSEGLKAAPTAFAARLAYADVLIKLARAGEATDQLRGVLKQVSSARVRLSACLLAKRAKLDLRPDC